MVIDLLQGTASGIATGAVFALAALGLSVFYNTSKVLNLAHGSLIMLVGLLLSSFVGREGPAWAPLLLGPVVGAVIAGTTYAVLIHPVRRRPPVQVLAITVGLLFVGIGAGHVWWGPDVRFLPPLSHDQHGVGDVFVSGHQVVTIALTLGATAVTVLFLHRTFTGKALRAVADDPEGARAVGISTFRMMTIGAVLSGALAGLAAALVMPTNGVDPEYAGSLTLYAVAAAVLGGLGRVDGALFGGLLLGVAAGVTQALSARLFDVIQYLLLLVVLIIVPHGLGGLRLRTAS